MLPLLVFCSLACVASSEGVPVVVPPLTSFFSNFKSGDSDSGLGEIVAGDTSMTISCSDRDVCRVGIAF